MHRSAGRVGLVAAFALLALWGLVAAVRDTGLPATARTRASSDPGPSSPGMPHGWAAAIGSDQTPSRPANDTSADTASLPVTVQTAGGEASTSTTASPEPPPPPATPTWHGPKDLLGRVVYSTGTSTRTALWSMRPDGTDRRQEVPCPLSTGSRTFPSAVSPDGTHVVRVCGLPYAYEPPSPAFAEVFTPYQWVVQAVDGSSTVRLGDITAGQPWLPEPTWSPDGTKIAIPMYLGLYIYDAGSGALSILDLDGVGSPYSPSVASWAPDSRHVVIADLRIVDTLDGSSVALQRPNATPIGGFSPFDLETWAPGGNWIYFSQTIDSRDAPQVTRYMRVRPDDQYAEVVLDESFPSDYQAVHRPVFLDESHALVAYDGALWSLTVDNTSGDEPSGQTGTLSKISDDFDGNYLSIATR